MRKLNVTEKNVDIVRRELKHTFIKNNVEMLVITVVCLTFLSALNVCISVLLQKIIDTIAQNDMAGLVHLSLYSVGVFVLLIIVFLIQRQSSPTFIRRATTQYKEFAFEHLLDLDKSSLSAENTSKYISMLTNDVVSIETNYLSVLFTFYMDSIGLVFAFIVMLQYSPFLTLLAVVFAMLPVTSSIMFGSKLARDEKLVSENNECFVNCVKEVLSGISIVKAFQAEGEMMSMFRVRNNQLEYAKCTRRKTSELVNLCAAGAGVIAQLGIFICAAFMALSGENITSGTVIVFLNLMGFVVSPIVSIPNIMAQKKAASGLVGRMAELLGRGQEESGVEISGILENDIVLDRLNFGYEHQKNVLKDLSFSFKVGKSYAIVGHTGSGKTTLLNILLGNYRDYRGSIRVDGTELNTIAQSALYKLYSVIDQDVCVFNDSILNNITLYKHSERNCVQKAVEFAGLSGLADAKGLDYLCGEEGANLSGGEKQRVAIARCLLRSAHILLVDEATAALDKPTAANILNTILDLKGMTKIIVTHYLEPSVLQRFDEILVISDGKISESGTYKQLMEQKSDFYSLVVSACNEGDK
ncbi:MAG: ABC transporter ATP-binding protein [Eubacteriales bacterium]|nr:ABC transporter ATP-binding protein [Eubacteriales bacterium]